MAVCVFVFDEIFASVIVFVFETQKNVFVFDKTYLTPALIMMMNMIMLLLLLMMMMQ